MLLWSSKGSQIYTYHLQTKINTALCHEAKQGCHKSKKISLQSTAVWKSYIANTCLIYSGNDLTINKKRYNVMVKGPGSYGDGLELNIQTS